MDKSGETEERWSCGEIDSIKMKIKKQLRPPEYWQDFESLCKTLWGEIWDCHEIVKNGRQGQPQNGVDVYGIPKWDTEYYGIQCKGKDNYTHKQFTKAEIDKEILKAAKFKPALKKFYLATTAVKDSSIEEHVRIKNLENKKANLFEIYIFSWEDIVDLIDENKRTHDLYLRGQNFTQNKKVKLTFHDNSEEIKISVPFVKTINQYKQRIFDEKKGLQSLGLDRVSFFKQDLRSVSLFDTKVNRSCAQLYFRIHNTGQEPIENFKIFLDFKGEFIKIKTKSKMVGFVSSKIDYSYDTYIDNEKKSGEIIPKTDILVGEDSVGFDDIIIKPFPRLEPITINWKLISKDYTEEGSLSLVIEPEIKVIYKTIIVDEPSQVRIVEGEIEDYITD